MVGRRIANAAGFILPDYLTNNANSVSSSNNILNKLAPYESIPNGHSSLEEYGGYLNEKNSFVPSTNLRERRKGTSYMDNDSSQKSNFYDRQIDDQNQYEPLYSHKHLSKHHHHAHHSQPRDNEFASNSLLESVSPLDNGQDFGFGSNFLSNDFGSTGSNYNTELSLNNLSGLRSLSALSALSPALGLNSGFNNLSPLNTASSSLVGTLGGSLNGLNGLGNGLNSVVPAGAIVGGKKNTHLIKVSILINSKII